MNRLFQKNLFLFFLLILVFSGCTRKENELIPDNIAPPDPTISNVTKENYVNKVYISLLGKKPDSTEFQQGLSILNKNNLSVDNRHELLDIIFSKPEYKNHLYSIARVDLLNDQDTNEIAQNIAIYEILLQDSSYMIIWDQINYEIARLNELRRVPAGLIDGTINEIELHHRCVNNYYYDQINMGTANFVVSMWQHFLIRYPTDEELYNASKMVDGFNAIVFLQTGVGKKDFLDIFFNSADYFEGQVRDLYSRYLFRLPSSSEMSAAAVKYKNSKNYQELQKDILSFNEYVGIK